MDTVVKEFDELSAKELYGIIRARTEVFVVEQKCPYQELDGLDIFSTHLYFSQNGEIAAYLRIVPPGKRFEEVSFGRIFTSLPYRGKGLGAKLMEEGIKAAEKIYGKCPIRISAQKHACGFYEKFGFIKDSEEYDEDGIVHIEMIRK
ncbi:MAG: GNAT family N-acetyltransferase [Clostridia bacterium]|nr:GNAT family N-acetyltransferase [Clostridia bacterium]